ncbi:MULTISPECIES: TIGR03752 family integrating conjugative element protein [unclassified Pseudomonas]|uniref:TIGR03752 family integrating conjugative element protein n=1 Tax=unclassified Pseudomonas TaxID=196821 RepID=UPI002457DA89|nr:MULTISPECIES: TIGR03752 family integrating conjugative element protein [unclassified Pseudomonas]MDH4564504.1 TIGR03752 family integrating conjugative element protein [Pseudomonas sp. BN411]MDH4655293.1 TIGR03752 family integrating conjugative element protein [Pseudomonas sp. BN606]
MHSNGLLKWLMIPLALLLVLIGLKLFSGGKDASSPLETDSRLTPEEAKALGIEGDTPRDTVATLVAQVRQLRTELQTALSDNKTQREENARLRQRENAIDRRIKSALESERNQLRQDREHVATERQQTQNLLQELQQRLEGMGSDQDGQDDLPVGLGLEPGDGAEALRWIEPDDARDEGKRRTAGNPAGVIFPTRFGPAQKTLETKARAAVDAGRRAAGVPDTQAVYTVPTNATLMGSIAMTALIGRVPVDGTVNDPYPFKVLIGPDNLTANGIDIPDVAGAVVSGTASGDWTLSCVRGHIRSVTFVFQDGTIRTVPEDRGAGARGGGSQRSSDDSTTQNSLGWISDPYGIPCVSGERRSNAQQYLGSQALITAAGAGVASLIDADSGQVPYMNSDGSIGTLGIGGNEAMGRILAGGVQDLSQWVNKLYGQAFAAVYVKPGAKVAVHLEEPLTIDYDPAGRRVDHRLGGRPHAQELD